MCVTDAVVVQPVVKVVARTAAWQSVMARSGTFSGSTASVSQRCRFAWRFAAMRDPLRCSILPDLDLKFVDQPFSDALSTTISTGQSTEI